MKPLDYIIDGILAILVMFLFTLLYFGLKQDSMIETLVQTDTSDFTQNFRSRGYLTKNMYDDFLEQLSKTGLMYDVGMEHRQLLYEPKYRMRTAEEVINERDSAFAGTNTYHYYDVKTDIPAVSDPVNAGNLNTDTNESILAKAVNKLADTNHVHTDACYTGHRHSTDYIDENGVHKNCYCPALRLKADRLDSPYGSRMYFNYSFYCKQCNEYILSIHKDVYGNYSITDMANNNCGDIFSSTPLTSAEDIALAQDLIALFGKYSHNTGNSTYGWLEGEMPAGLITKEPYYGAFTGCKFCSDYKIKLNGDFFTVTCLHCKKEVMIGYKNYESGYHYYLRLYKADGTNVTYSGSDSNIGNVTQEIKDFVSNMVMLGYSGHIPESYTFLSCTGGWEYENTNDASVRIIHIPYTWSGFNYSFLKHTIEHGCKTGNFTYCGLEGTLNCGNIVTSIFPTNPNQTVYVGDDVISTVLATHLDGSTTTIIATVSGYDKIKIGTQTVTLTYTGAVDTSITTGIKTCVITVTVIPRTKTCSNGHTYNLNAEGADPGCPYCKTWLRSLIVTDPVTGILTIYRGTTLKQNGVTLQATYMNGRTELVTDAYIDNLDKTYVGTQNVTITYKGQYTSLTIINKRNIVKCAVCGRYYELFQDDTDPGCPYCAAKTPIFTGNIMKYYDRKYTDAILMELYHGSGIYYLSRDDYLGIKLQNSSRSPGGKLTAAFFKSLADGNIRTQDGGYIRQSGQ